MPTSLRGTVRLSPSAYQTLRSLPYRDGSDSIVEYLHGGLAYDDATWTLTIDVKPENLYFNRALMKAIASVKDVDTIDVLDSIEIGEVSRRWFVRAGNYHDIADQVPFSPFAPSLTQVHELEELWSPGGPLARSVSADGDRVRLTLSTGELISVETWKFFEEGLFELPAERLALGRPFNFGTEIEWPTGENDLPVWIDVAKLVAEGERVAPPSEAAPAPNPSGGCYAPATCALPGLPYALRRSAGGAQILVVADGASSWGRGHEASRFAAAQVASALASLPAIVDLAAALQRAITTAVDDAFQRFAGGDDLPSFALAAAFVDGGLAHLGWVGGCGLLQLRDGAVHWRAEVTAGGTQPPACALAEVVLLRGDTLALTSEALALATPDAVAALVGCLAAPGDPVRALLAPLDERSGPERTIVVLRVA